jgi:dihydroxyacid dehydratase/phosphogluconate dehydratase
MYLRNLMSMDTEEMMRAQPMDAVVLIGGCDKTVPAQLMGAASAGIPAIQLITGPMLTGSHRGERWAPAPTAAATGASTAPRSTREEIADVNNQLVASVGTCSVMGTASTMACIAEALGMTVPGGASPPAVTADRMRIAERPARTAVQMARGRPDHRQDPDARRLRERDARAAGHRRLDQRHRPPDRHRRPHGLDIDLQRSTAWAARRRCCWTSSLPASTTWKTSTRPAAWRRCCAS